MFSAGRGGLTGGEWSLAMTTEETFGQLLGLGASYGGVNRGFAGIDARVDRMIGRHSEGILGHWTQGQAPDLVEGLNSMFSAVKRKARGYRTVE